MTSGMSLPTIQDAGDCQVVALVAEEDAAVLGTEPDQGRLGVPKLLCVPVAGLGVAGQRFFWNVRLGNARQSELSKLRDSAIGLRAVADAEDIEPVAVIVIADAPVSDAENRVSLNTVIPFPRFGRWHALPQCPVLRQEAVRRTPNRCNEGDSEHGADGKV